MSSVVVSDRARGAARGALLGVCATVPQMVMTWRGFRLGHGSRWLMLLPFSVAAACGAVAGVMAARVASQRLRKVFAISLAAYLASAVILGWIATMDSVVELSRHGPAQFRRWEHVPLVLLETALFSIVIAVQALWINGIPFLAFVFVLERWTRPKVSQPSEG